jgi:hypothetical protein
MQREEYDGSKIPMSGYNNSYSEHSLNLNLSSEDQGGPSRDDLFYITDTMSNEKFLQENNFVKFGYRKFIDNEYIAISHGFSVDFVFCLAKIYIKNNKSDKSLIDKDQFNFYSFINFIRNDIALVSLRFIPLYILFDETSIGMYEEKTPKNLINELDYKESQGAELIQRYISKYVYENKIFDDLLAVDWNEKKFKKRDTVIMNSLFTSINFFIALYNFSTYENTLHWNKKW